MEEDSNEDTTDDDDEDEMSDDEEADDNMTLVQFQEEARREALIRKSTPYSGSSPKKGRMEPENSGS